MRVKITDIHPESHWFSNRNEIIGKEYDAIKINKANYDGWFLVATNQLKMFSITCKYIEVPEPSAMSELGNYDTFAEWLKGRFGYQPEPKKLTWLQKIRGYDDLQARCNSAESMRDHYKTQLESWESLAISKARELEIANKVCDNLERIATERGERADKYCEALETIMVTIENLFKDIVK